MFSGPKAATIAGLGPENDAARTLWYAAYHGDAGLTRELLAEGTDPNVGVEGKTPLMEAVDEPGGYFDARHEAVVRALLAAGADVNAADQQGWTALHFAGRADVLAVELLVSAGADPNARAVDGTTPLHEAAEYCNVEAARVLIAAGGDPTARTDEGLSPLDVARRHHDPIEIRSLIFLFEGG